MPSDDSLDSAERKRALERIVFSKGAPADIERAARELAAFHVSPVAEPPSVAEPASVAEPPSVAELVEAPASRSVAEPPSVAELVEAPAPVPRRQTRIVVAGALAVALGVGVLLGSFAPQSVVDAGADAGAGAADKTLVTGDSFLSSGAAVSRKGSAFIDNSTGQIVGYASTAAAGALAVFDRAQTTADQPTFPLAADLQPSSTRLLDMAGGASIFAARDTLARPCLVVVGPNQYAATCPTSFDFPKAGIRLSWAPSVSVNTSGPAESGRTSPVVYTAVWLADGSIEVGALVQGQ